jgi:spore maturation protein CgeB
MGTAPWKWNEHLTCSTGGTTLKPLQLDIAILGLSITSSWGNGHATTYRCLLRGLAQRGHRVLFLERDVPWYASNRDVQSVPYADVQLYSSLDELRDRFGGAIRNADLVIVGSYVPEGAIAGQWVLETAHGTTAFYDIDTPVTLSKLESGDRAYITPELIPRYHLYLSFTGGATLSHLESHYGARLARPLYCAVDPEDYYPDPQPARWSLGFMGTYSEDRQPAVEQLLMAPAAALPSQNFCVAGSMFPDALAWPENVERITHLPPGEHRHFYNAQRFTLNLTRVQMIRAGYSPSVRLFEAAACGTPIISDRWPGLEEFFVPGSEILTAASSEDVVRYLSTIPEKNRIEIAERARTATLRRHTGAHRAQELERYFQEASAPGSLRVSTPHSAAGDD